MQMKWLPLRLNILPVIHKQVQKLRDTFIVTRADIQEGDILALDTLKHMQEEVQSRIKQIDIFYNQHAMDPRTKYLFSTKTILVQISEGALEFIKSYDKYIEGPQKEEQLSKSNTIQERLKTPEGEEYIMITPKREDMKFNDSSTYFKADRNNYEESNISSRGRNAAKGPDIKKYQDKGEDKGEQMRLSDLKKQKNKSSRNKSPTVFLKEDPRKGTGRKVEQSNVNAGLKQNEDWVLQDKERKESALRLSRDNEVKKSFRDLSELVFTIKMTKEQYNQFMKLKRKNNHA